MKTLASTALIGLTLADLILRVDEQQFHHQYTRVAVLMVLGLVSCGGLALCGVIAYLVWR